MIEPRHYHDLVSMLEYGRPHYSQMEEKFIRRFIKPLGTKEDAFGNHSIVVGPQPTILWSCHTDTVHRQGVRQRLSLVGGRLQLHPKSRSNCLGADNTAGVWMLTRMIRAKIPGLYLFHRGEETGCQGSRYILDKRSDLLEGIQAAIAFDRMGTHDIISHQLGERCCSSAFIDSLADGLGMGHRAAYGMYTDTATYTRIIPECTNISVGYSGAHWKNESLDVAYLGRLLAAVLAMDLGKLKIVRDPSAIEDKPWTHWHKPANRGQQGGLWDWEDEQPEALHAAHPYTAKANGYPAAANRNNKSRGFLDEDRHHRRGVEPAETFGGSYDDGSWDRPKRLVTVADWLRAYPDEAADYLESHGFDASDFRDHIDKVQGAQPETTIIPGM